MLIALVFIIVFTLLFGRVFCGWVCPQTIFLEMIFRRIEFWIEGPAHKQMANDKKKEKPSGYYFRKVLKHIIFYAISFCIANIFLAYIIGIEELYSIITGPVSDHLVGLGALLAFSTIFYAVFAYVREIVCTVICPYGRLQSVLLDKQSVAVAYDYNRGEPRNKKRKGVDKIGDCIDCGMCVNVCPTGIDIRNGIQMECTNCTACIDACNMMMKKVGLKPNLITFASEYQLENDRVGKRRLNYRSKIFIALLIVLIGVFATMLSRRTVFDATVLRVPGQLYQEHKDGTITNLYKIKIVNKAPNTLPFSLSVEAPYAQIELVGQQLDSLDSGVHTEQTFFIKMPKDKLANRKSKLKVVILSNKEVIDTKEVSFLGGY
jgi:cytochrome c oxidase accessory protein FixG